MQGAGRVKEKKTNKNRLPLCFNTFNKFGRILSIEIKGSIGRGWVKVVVTYCLELRLLESLKSKGRSDGKGAM